MSSDKRRKWIVQKLQTKNNLKISEILGNEIQKKWKVELVHTMNIIHKN